MQGLGLQYTGICRGGQIPPPPPPGGKIALSHTRKSLAPTGPTVPLLSE